MCIHTKGGNKEKRNYFCSSQLYIRRTIYLDKNIFWEFFHFLLAVVINCFQTKKTSNKRIYCHIESINKTIFASTPPYCFWKSKMFENVPTGLWIRLCVLCNNKSTDLASWEKKILLTIKLISVAFSSIKHSSIGKWKTLNKNFWEKMLGEIQK